MLSKAEIEKAKENIIKQLENTKKANECGLATKGEFNEDIDAIETLLQYIDQLELENNKLSKMTDEMLQQLYKLHNISDSDCFIPREYSDINDCVKKASCTECIKQYFEKKVEEN